MNEKILSREWFEEYMWCAIAAFSTTEDGDVRHSEVLAHDSALRAEIEKRDQEIKELRGMLQEWVDLLCDGAVNVGENEADVMSERTMAKLAEPMP